MTSSVELIPAGGAATPGYTTIEWSQVDSRQPHHLDTRIGPWFEEFGAPSRAAVGFGRVAAAVFVADRLTPRNQLRQARTISLRVCVPDPTALDASRVDLETLLRWLTGDEWTISLSQDPTPRPDVAVDVKHAAEVSLLSGGLDSFCGLLVRGTDRLFLSHSDAPGIKRSQAASGDWLASRGHLADVTNVRLAPPAGRGREPSRRSRSFLFVGLAVVLADAVGARTVEIPENGFTSLNMPLAANRGGVLTTRSTHPWTFELMSRALVSAGLAMTLSNPYEFSTKGELVGLAAQKVGAQALEAGIPFTLSCAKSNPVLRGSGFGHNCGLDYACLVRRAGILAAGLPDRSTYLLNHLAPPERELLIAQRRSDITAVRLALARGASMEELLARGGRFPQGYDLARACDLWARGLKELGLVPLP